MGASLRSTLALLAVAVLGFGAGSLVDRFEPKRPGASPVRSPDPAAAVSLALPETPGNGLPRVPDSLAGILRLRGDFAQTTALYVLASGKDRNGIERLLDEAASIRQRSESRAAASILYERFAEIDPEAAVRHIMSRDADFDPTWLLGVFHTWSRTDLKSAVDYASTLDDRSRTMAGSAIVGALDDLPAGEREIIAAKLKLQVAQQDPSAIDLRTPQAAERSWRSALATADRDARSMKLHTLIHAWARQDPRSAIAAIESLADRSLREELLHPGMQAWAEKEPRQAVDWALARPPSQERVQILASTLGALVTREPSVAMEIIEALSKIERRQVLPQVLSNWANTDARSAADRAESLEDTHLRSEALMHVAMIYAMQDADEAFRWAAALPETDSQVAMAMVISQMASSDPARASAQVSQMNSGPQRENAIQVVAQHWAQWDPQAAIGWLAKLPASDVGAAAYRSVFEQWASHDVEAAIGHSTQFFDSGHRDAALTGILGSPYLEAGLISRLYARIQGAEARRQAAMQLYYRFSESDPESAERYRIEAGMHDETERAVIER